MPARASAKKLGRASSPAGADRAVRRILVTRPEPGASATAARLQAMGFCPVVLPLTRIVATPPAASGPCDAVIATSANALRHAPADFLAQLRARKLFAVGEATASAARRAGFSTIAAAAGTAADLAALIGREMPAGARLLHLAGRERTQGFEEDLAARGFTVSVVETYRAEEVACEAGFISDRLAGAPLWGALVFSERGGMLLSVLARRPEASQAFEETRFFCISAKVAAQLAGFDRRVAETPTEEAVLALLSSQG